MSKYLSLSGLIVTCVLGMSWALTGVAEEPAPKGDTPPAAAGKLDQAALEKEFKQTMSGCVLVGRFTVVGRENQSPKEERYIITKAAKQDDGEWIIVYKYGNSDTVIPIKLKVEWAGDTPVITLTDLTIPGVGTFTSRVLIHRGWYAGTWQHGEVGGHLYGKIEKLPEDQKSTKKKSDKEEPKKE